MTVIDDIGIAESLLRRCRMVEADKDAWRAWSTGEKLAVGLILNRPDILKAVNGGYTILEAVDRVGEDWMRACMITHKLLRDETQ